MKRHRERDGRVGQGKVRKAKRRKGLLNMGENVKGKW